MHPLIKLPQVLILHRRESGRQAELHLGVDQRFQRQLVRPVLVHLRPSPLQRNQNPNQLPAQVFPECICFLHCPAGFREGNTGVIQLNTTDQDDTSDTGLLQNTRGVVFFLVSFCTMTGIQTTLNTFSGEKPIFLRERFSKTYSTLPYFWGRSLATFPFEIIYGSIPCIIIFWGCGLNNNNEWNFPTLLLVSNVLYFASVSYGLFYSAIIPKLETAMAMIPVLIIPFMMLSGFFINLDDVPKAFIPLEYLSPFRYGYQGMIMNEFHGKGYLSELVFIPKTILLNIIALLSLGVGLRFLSLITMYFISNPKRPKINQEKKISNSIKS